MEEIPTRANSDDLQGQRSTFVTVLAWIFIIIGAVASFLGLMQNVMLQMVFSQEEIALFLGQPGEESRMPGYVTFLLLHLDMVFLTFLLLAVLLLLVSIALLKRRNWARLVFILFMSIAAIWNVVGIILQVRLFRGFLDLAGAQGMAVDFHNMMMVMQVFMLFLAAAMTAGCIYIAVMLCTRQIRREFTNGTYRGA